MSMLDTQIIDDISIQEMNKTDSILKLISSHEIKKGELLENYDKIDVGKTLKDLGIPEHWILAMYDTGITGKQLMQMPPKWKWFIQMGFRDIGHCVTIEDKIRDLLKLNKAKGNSKKKDTLSISGEFEPKKDKTNIKKKKKKK